MRLAVKLFAILREKAGASEASIDLPEGATVSSATAAVAQRFPVIKDLIPKSGVAINRQYARADDALKDGDELALIPAVSGG
jgi:molybdopterin converting factor subunit 1